MDIDLLFDNPEQSSSSSSTNVLQDSPSKLTTTETSELFEENLPSENVILTSSLPEEGLCNQKTESVITKIATISTSILGCITSGAERVEIQMKSRAKQKITSQLDTEIFPRKENRPQKTRFPAKCPAEVRRFAAIHRIFDLSNDALVNGIITTKRDIYYQDPVLFTTQAVVNRYVDDIAYTLGVNRDDLNVGAAAKGLILGDLTVTKKEGVPIQYWSELDGQLVPKVEDLDHVEVGRARWILVVEKEATFRTLAASEHWRTSSSGAGILITAKGYPDIQTRQFLQFLSTTCPQIPIFALVDYDPDGIGIMATYKHGSRSLAHETNLNVPSLQWLGVRSSNAFTNKSGQGLLPLTKRDRRIATSMLARQELATGEAEWGREIQVMLMMNMKAEIQIIGNEEQLGVWLDRRLSSALDNLKLEVKSDVDADGDILMV